MAQILDKNVPLGKDTVYSSQYDPALLFPVPRKDNRKTIGIEEELPFTGVDIWNAYELSWLNSKGKPEVGLAEIFVPCASENIIESKSLKLYFNSLNQSKFNSVPELKEIIEHDLSKAANGDVKINLRKPTEYSEEKFRNFNGICLDDLDIEVDCYDTNESFLKAEDEVVEEELYSYLLKSNCPVTGQPDWASLIIRYKGRKINHEGLLRYIISFREHSGFHEICIEQIFMAISKICQPEKLTVYARYTRRGGIDINPFRTNCSEEAGNLREARQ